MSDALPKNRIAIASCHDKVNFGSALQAFATQRALSDMGAESLTLNKRGLSGAIASGRRSYYVEHLFDANFYHAKLGFVGHRVKQKIDKPFGAKMAERKRAFSAFEESHFAFTPKTSTFEELSELVSSSFDSVVVGSDQLWLPVNIAGDYYTLSFVKSPVRKVSYSTSFGVSTLPEKYMKRVADFLGGFDAISVREETGADLVEAATGKRCDIVCDPTMLLSASQWDDVASAASDVVPDEPYLLCYFLGNNIWNRECAKELAKERGLKIVAVAHPDEYVKYDDGYADYYPWNAGPAEWVSLIQNAAFVCTDSFHGSVFSNIFHVPFFSFRRHENMGEQSTNSRIDTLLNVLGDADRICESREMFEAAASRDVDFDSVERKLEAYRSESAAWLSAAVELGGC